MLAFTCDARRVLRERVFARSEAAAQDCGALAALRGELDPVVGRDDVIEQTLDVLAKREQIVTTDPGSLASAREILDRTIRTVAKNLVEGAILVVVVLFLVLQRYFVRALTEGAVKH